MMDVLYYWIMGLMVGIGIGAILPDTPALVCAVVGFVMSVLTIGWYGRKMWASMDEESE